MKYIAIDSFIDIYIYMYLYVHDYIFLFCMYLQMMILYFPAFTDILGHIYLDLLYPVSHASLAGSIFFTYAYREQILFPTGCNFYSTKHHRHHHILGRALGDQQLTYMPETG
jgi:hypothetical protein